MVVSAIIFCFSSFVFVVFLTILCLGRRKKKTVTTAATIEENGQRNSRHSSNIAGGEDGYASIDVVNPNAVTNNAVPGSVGAGGQARVLPDIPSQDTTTSGNLPRPNSRSEHSSLGSGELVRRHSNSPKAEQQTKSRKLPNPPDAADNNKDASTMQMNDGDDVTNVYANVDEEKQQVPPQRRKIRTLDIKEGSGDSSFYAKVGDVVEEVGGEMLYAQVNDDLPSTTQPPSLPPSWSTDEHLMPASSPPLPKPNSMKSTQQQQIYQDAGGPEYATIDKLNKKSPTTSHSSNQSTSANGDMDDMETAPPIPERNFIDTDDDELDDADVDDRLANIPHIDDDDTDEQETSKGVVYDKLCVRESLDHLRNRKEVECQRRAKYANIQEDVGDVAQDQTAVYAQIDENVAEEAVYESVSGSGDGSFQPQQAPIPILPPQPPTPQPPHIAPQHHHHHLVRERETSFSSSNRTSNNNTTRSLHEDHHHHNSHTSRHHYEQIRHKLV